MLRGIGKPKRTGGPGDSELACRSQQVRRTPRTAKGTQQPRTAREVQEPGAGAGDPAWVGGGAALRAWRRSAAASVLSSPDAAGFLSVPESAPGTHARAPSAASPLACPLSFLLCPRMGTGDALSHPARCSWRLSFWGTSWYQVPGVFFAPAEASVVEVPVIFHSGHLMTRTSGLTGTGQSLALGTPRGGGRRVRACPAPPADSPLLPSSRFPSSLPPSGTGSWCP